MTTHRIDHGLSPLEHARLFEAARQAALQARREAVDAFWSAMGRAVGDGFAAGRRLLRRALARGHADSARA